MSEETLAATESATTKPQAGHREAELSRGDVLGRYVVLSRIGSGGMGVVYAAYDPELDRKVAIKRLRGDASSAHAGGDGGLRR